MIVNLYVDHMMTAPPSSAEEVWNATKEHPRIYGEAARRIGLTPSEYSEFRNDLLDGKAVYVRLPAHMDAMAGDRHGSIYAVHNAYMPKPVMGWKVTLASGAVVYVPQTCGNLAMSRPVSFVKPAKHVPRTVVTRVVPQATPVPPTVVMAEATSPPVAYVPPPAAPVAAAAGGFGWLAGIPLLGGLIYVVTHHNTPPPSCNNGSNETNVCTK
jgi:hypothetical protein